MPRVTIEGEEIFYTLHQGDKKQERNLVYIHGAGGSHLNWPPQLRRMAGVNAHALDLPGHGRSKGVGRASIVAYRDFVAAFLQVIGLEKATLVGHSMGAAISLDFALHYPTRLGSMILIGSGARLRVAPAILNGFLQDFEATVRLVCEYAYAPDASEQLMGLGCRQMLGMSPQVLHNDFLACDAFDVTDRLGEIGCPTLVICGTEDKLTPSEYSAYLRDHIAGARLTLVEGAGHMVMLEQPEVVSQAIALFP